MQKTTLLLTVLSVCSGPFCTGFAEESVQFERDIWPILVSRCIECHGEAKQEGELRLDSPDHIRAGGAFGDAVSAGDLEGSAIFELVSLPLDDKEAMPGRGERLPESQLNTIERWILDGADFDGWNMDLQTAANDAVAARDVANVPKKSELPKEHVSFNRDVRSILTENCFTCHGPDGGAREADLRLDGAEFATADLGGRQAIRPGSLKKSEMVRRLFHEDPAQRMPPADSSWQPSEQERRILAAWIAQGAEYEEHWAYVAPQRSEAFDTAKSAHPVDTLLQEQIESAGLQARDQADPRTLVRRLSFDLTGLPPTKEQVERFVASPTDEVYQELVEQMLASPQYGERMAMHWLDQVRYADTNGYHSDETRHVTAYRNYVIDSFNANKPYDRFTIEQLAGDLLPNPTIEDQIAAGFNRMNQLSAEGGAQSKEYRAMYAADRVRALGSVWMGATLGCAECHDHKFDPYTAKNFYQFASFFSDLEEHGVYTTGETWDPIMYLPTDEEQSWVEQLDGVIEALKEEKATQDVRESFHAWIQAATTAPEEGWHPVRPRELRSEFGTEFEVLDDFSVLTSGIKPPWDDYYAEVSTDGRAVTGIRLEIMGHAKLREGISRANSAAIEISEVEAWHTDTNGERQQLAFEKAESDRTKYGSPAALIDGKLHSRMMITSAKPIVDKVTIVFTLEEPLSADVNSIEIAIRHRGLNKRVLVGRYRISLTSDAKPALEPDSHGVPRAYIGTTLDNLVSDDADAAENIAEGYFREMSPDLADIRTKITEAEVERQALVSEMGSTLISKSVEPRMTRILPRGDWMNDTGEEVTPDVPEFLPPLNVKGRRATRLDLAKWLVQDDNPLTARVFVNRLWKLYFGHGISARLDDFGGQGQWPTHPELLDALALEFRDSGWDIQHVIKLIVTSKAYQQDSGSTPRMKEVDPENQLYARQTRPRLEAEMIRDNALAISGLLDDTIGGKTVKPYQPDGYWRNAQAFGGESLEYTPSPGAEQYRRGVYTYWKRSFLHPSLLAFDAPTREECTAERAVSNTPSQALVLLNDPTYVEAARAFAEMILREGGDNAATRVQFAFARALSRPATLDEAAILIALAKRHGATYEASPEEAKKLIAVGQKEVATDIDAAELASWTSVARTILNLPEVITRF